MFKVIVPAVRPSPYALTLPVGFRASIFSPNGLLFSSRTTKTHRRPSEESAAKHRRSKRDNDGNAELSRHVPYTVTESNQGAVDYEKRLQEVASTMSVIIDLNMGSRSDVLPMESKSKASKTSSRVNTSDANEKHRFSISTATDTSRPTRSSDGNAKRGY